MGLLYKDEKIALCEENNHADINALLARVVANWDKPVPDYYWDDVIIEALVNFDAQVNGQSRYFLILDKDDIDMLKKNGFDTGDPAWEERIDTAKKEGVPEDELIDLPVVETIAKIDISKRLPKRDDGGNYSRIISKDYARKAIDAIRFMVELYLLPENIDRYGYLLEVIPKKPSKKVRNKIRKLKYEFWLPTYLSYWFEERMMTSNVGKIEINNMVNYESYDLDKDAYSIGLFRLTATHFRNNELTDAATCLLHDIFYWTYEPSHFVDETKGYTKKEYPNLIQALFKPLIEEEKIIACPWCRKPVYLKHDTSKKYCSVTCKSRYREAALSDFYDGMSKRKLMKKYPYINKKTVENW